MKLHLDRIAFEQLIDIIASQSGVRRDVIEKDYYVTLLLEELSKLPNQGYAYFKGGTALYKALRSIRRFSEDIDLTVFVEDCPSANQARKRLEKATLQFQSMQKGNTIKNERGSIVCEYLYESMFEFDKDDALQRFGRVIVESTSFTVSEPTTTIQIAPFLYELCDDEQRKILTNSYDVAPFSIETISLERIFIDKVFATEFYYERGEYTDVAKHVYDITVLLRENQIRSFLADKSKMQTIIGLKRKEELNRRGGVDADLKVADFSYFNGLKGSKEFRTKFADMQKVYVLNRTDALTVEEAFSAIAELHRYIDC